MNLFIGFGIFLGILLLITNIAIAFSEIRTQRELPAGEVLQNQIDTLKRTLTSCIIAEFFFAFVGITFSVMLARFPLGIVFIIFCSYSFIIFLSLIIVVSVSLRRRLKKSENDLKGLAESNPNG